MVEVFSNACTDVLVSLRKEIPLPTLFHPKVVILVLGPGGWKPGVGGHGVHLVLYLFVLCVCACEC